ncbi:MAG: IS630 family transposase [Bradymonadaceae bacterium]
MGSTTKDDFIRRALAVLEMGNCETVKAVSERVGATRKSVARWRDWYREDGIDGLRTDGRGAPNTTVCPRLMAAVETALECTPQDFEYIRSRWTSELLSEVAEGICGIWAHPSTIRRLLPEMGYVWCRARPTEANRLDPRRAEKLEAIDQIIRLDEARTEVFYVDEASIDLNPRIGAEWTPVGQQPRIITPGQNQKRYVIGALHKDSGRVTWRTGESADSDLVVDFLEQLRLRYRRANEIKIIWDNASYHHSTDTLEWLDEYAKFEVFYQPTYTPSVNAIEKVWKQLHEVVTRNHRHHSIEELMAAAVQFLDAIEPFPGSNPGMVKLAA